MNKIAGLFVIAATSIATIALVLWLYTLPSADSLQVTLNSTAYNPLVPMWDVVGTGSNDVVHEFPAGTHCTIVTGPAYYDVAGTPLQYYKLTCNGVTGYVSSKWVDN